MRGWQEGAAVPFGKVSKVESKSITDAAASSKDTELEHEHEQEGAKSAADRELDAALNLARELAVPPQASPPPISLPSPFSTLPSMSPLSVLSVPHGYASGVQSSAKG